MVALLCCLALAGCGGDDGAGGEASQTGDTESTGQPTIVSARIVDSQVRVVYRVPGADGGVWPTMLLSILEPEARPSPSNEEVHPVEAEGEATISREVGPSREIIVFGSVFYEDGRRLYLPEKHLRSPAGATGGIGPPLDPATAHRNCVYAEESIKRPDVRCGR